MKNFKLLLFAFTLMFSVSAIAAPTSDKAPKAKKEHKTTADKKDKKFVSVTFYYDGLGSITSQSSWTTTGSCPITGNSVLCSITFDTDTYPLDTNGKPTVAFLTNQVAVHYTDSPTLHSFTVNGVTYTRRTS